MTRVSPQQLGVAREDNIVLRGRRGSVSVDLKGGTASNNDRPDENRTQRNCAGSPHMDVSPSLGGVTDEQGWQARSASGSVSESVSKSSLFGSDPRRSPFPWTIRLPMKNAGAAPWRTQPWRRDLPGSGPPAYGFTNR